MDDATIQEAIDLEAELENDSNDDLVLPKEHTEIQNQIDIIKKLSDEREMSMNANKTFILVNNFTNNHQFIPQLKQEKFLVLLRVKKRTMKKRMGPGKMLSKSQVKTGIQVVFRNHDMNSPASSEENPVLKKEQSQSL